MVNHESDRSPTGVPPSTSPTPTGTDGASREAVHHQPYSFRDEGMSTSMLYPCRQTGVSSVLWRTTVNRQVPVGKDATRDWWEPSDRGA